MSSELFLGDKKYISAKKASSLTGYSRDYVGQLARGNKIDSKKIRGVWYVEEKSILQYKDFSIELDQKITLPTKLPSSPRAPILIRLPPKTFWSEIKKNSLKKSLSLDKKLLLFAFGLLLSVGAFSVIDNNFFNQQFNGTNLTGNIFNTIPSYLAKLPGSITDTFSDFIYYDCLRRLFRFSWNCQFGNYIKTTFKTI